MNMTYFGLFGGPGQEGTPAFDDPRVLPRNLILAVLCLSFRTLRFFGSSSLRNIEVKSVTLRRGSEVRQVTVVSPSMPWIKLMSLRQGV